MFIDEMGEYLVLKGFKELDSSRFKKGNTIVHLGVRGSYDNWRMTESGEYVAQGSGISELISRLK